MIYTVTLNPALDKTVEIPSLAIDSVNRITAMRTDPGGKGINVSKVIHKLGGKSVAAGILGGATGRAIRSALEEMGLETAFCFVEGETRTNLKVVDPVSTLLGRLSAGDIVALSGSLPKGAPEDTYRTWVAACRERGAKTILDADGPLLAAGLEASPYLIKPNNHELSRLLGRELKTKEELAEAARGLMARYGIARVVVSMGGDGALYATEKETLYAEGLKVPVGSTVGAGDSVVAALALAEERGLGLEDTVRLSMATGAANVMCSGTQAAEYETVAGLLPRVAFHRL